MSSVKSLRGRGLDLPHTGRWLRRKHRTVIMLLVCLFFVCLVVLARESSAKARYTTDALAKETVKVAKTVEKRAGKAFTGW